MMLHDTLRHTFLSMLGSLMVLAATPLSAANCNSNGNGNWATGGTWTCGNPPNSGDEMVIEANSTVTINSNLSYAGSPMRVVVHGIWRFSGGGAKIAMPCGSSVVIGFGGQVQGNGTGNSQTIRICNTTYWSASDGVEVGPSAWPIEALPVELISFNGASKGRSVDIEWTTASEMNSASFELFRSSEDGFWQQVATVAAAGLSSNRRNYSVKDEVPVAGDWYYRLQQVDQDGMRHDKGIITIHVEHEKRDLICGPIPVVDGHVNAFWPKGEPVFAELRDPMGAFIPISYSKRENGVAVDLSNATTGVHILTVQDMRGERRSCRLIVQ